MMDKKDKAPKERRRNNEKRKEKSRDAARSRRTRETEIFTDLANALPLTQEQVLQLDKASVMRLAISYLRVRDMINLVSEFTTIEELECDKLNIAEESVFLKSLEGFLVVLSGDGDFVYLSENVSDYLGIPQIDLMGQNVFEYSHPCDHDEIRETLQCKSETDAERPKSIFIRLKCTLTSKGRSVNLKSATYKVIHCTGHVLKNNVKLENGQTNTKCCFVAVGQPIPHPSNIESPLPRQTFLTKHSLDMKFTHADDTIMTDVLGYTPDDLNGKSVYEYHHAMDSDAVCSAYKCLFAKGQCETNRYRFLAKTGGYVWVVTQATLIYDKIHKPQSVVCVNYIISGVECKDEIYSASQFASVKSASIINNNNETVSEVVIPLMEVVPAETVDNTKPVSITAKLFVPYNPAGPVRPQTATSKIFVNRTEEMNKGFLTFSDDEPGLTMLKDEPDDLTHLAPEAGDVCVPLVDHPFLTDILDDFLLRDNFGPLLNDEPLDPFLAYRDCNNSPQMLSPNISKNSECSLPSLNSPSDSLGEEEHMSTFINLQMEDEQTDLAVRASYNSIAMDGEPPLLPDDLMWGSIDKFYSRKNIPDSNSSLAQLLSSSVNKHSLKSSDDGSLHEEQTIEELYSSNDKNWSVKGRKSGKIERTPSTKRSHAMVYESSNKRTRNEPKEKMSSELLQQLMSNNHNRGRPKGKSNWLLDSGGQKAACISQPSDSVLMNLLDDPVKGTDQKLSKILLSKKRIQLALEKDKEEVQQRRNTIRKNSISLLDPESTAIPSFLDLTQQDFEVNAPVNKLLLGEDLLTALEVNAVI